MAPPKKPPPPRPTAKKATIRELAVASGASISTVSLVMNGSWERYRITPATAERVRAAARTLGYAPNQNARALRLQRSSLAGMIVPHHRNRFFAGLAESFESHARARGLVPIVVSTQRDPATEREVAATLVMQGVELLVVSGVRDPSDINRLCREKGVRSVNVDLPGPDAFSVVTDNRAGAETLTRHLLRDFTGDGPVLFLGGFDSEYATDLRVEGFLAALDAVGRPRAEARILRCGYHPAAAHAVLDDMLARNDFPRALLVNSITAFEGFATLWRSHGDRIGAPRIACFDWDPFAACLPLPTVMLRQDVEALVGACFDWFGGTSDRTGEIEIVPAQMVLDRIAAP